MIAVDISARVAIGLDELERVRFLTVIRDAPKALISIYRLSKRKCCCLAARDTAPL
jgi:hypothetical protein